jgi:hypothetical protein
MPPRSDAILGARNSINRSGKQFPEHSIVLIEPMGSIQSAMIRSLRSMDRMSRSMVSIRCSGNVFPERSTTSHAPMDSITDEQCRDHALHDRVRARASTDRTLGERFPRALEAFLDDEGLAIVARREVIACRGSVYRRR